MESHEGEGAHSHQHEHDEHAAHAPYRALALEVALDAVVMYFVMYTMIASLDHLHHNLNTAYMALMMVAPMLAMMLVFMRKMYPSRKHNVAILVGAAAVFVLSFVGMRKQVAINDEQFLRSMIPHHSGAILMCEEATLTDPAIIRLCENIIRSQSAEIDQMEAMLAHH